MTFALIVLKYVGITIGGLVLAAIVFIVGCAVVLSGRISRDEEKTAEYRELVRRLYLAHARAANDAAHEEPPVRLVAP